MSDPKITFKREWASSTGVPGEEVILEVFSDGKNSINVGVPVFIREQLPLPIETVEMICECVRRTLLNQPNGPI